jgi:hypothetical protein
MNIFVLDLDPQKCAEYHCNKHISKMVVEHCQILGSIAYTARGIRKKSEITKEFIEGTFQGFPRSLEGRPHPYGIGYRNHPCTQWASRSRENYQWLCDLTLKMCKEYTHRYGRRHAGEDICLWYAKNMPELANEGMTPFAQAMPIHCRQENAVEAYRQYYREYKSKFAKWPVDRVPDWWTSP